MQQKLKKILLLITLLLAPLAAKALNPVILGVTYESDPNIHIGSVITMYMSSIVPTQSIAAAAISTTASAITISSTALVSLPASLLYVSDGIRAWQVAFPGGVNTFSMSNVDLIRNTTPFQVADYNQLANNAFAVYTGTLITGASAGNPDMNIDLASFGSQVLNDGGSNGDAVGSDGVWTGLYNVPDLEFAIAGGRLFGRTILNGQLATNAPYQSMVSFNIDGVRPSIDVISYRTTNPNYNDIMYIARSTQGTTNFNPDSSQARFDLQVNKKDTAVDIVINAPAAKNLPTLVIPSGSINTNGWRVWDGTDGNGNYLADGTYLVSLYIHDINNVVGLTKTTQVKIISIKTEISNISLSPSGLTTEPAFTNSLVTNVFYTSTLETDTPGASMKSSLDVLGWGFAPLINDNTSIFSSVYAVNEVSFLNPAGGVGIAVTTGDGNPGGDDDIIYLLRYVCDTVDFTGLVPACKYAPAGTFACEESSGSGTIRVADGNKSNDWTTAFLKQYNIISGSQAAPSKMSCSFSVAVVGATPPAGSYRLRVRSILSALNFAQGPPPSTPDTFDPCVAASLATVPVYSSAPVHFYPSARPEGPYTNQGSGIFQEDHSTMFTVANVAPSTSDTTPPVFLNSSPQSNAQINPNVYGPNNLLQAKVQDVETGIDSSNADTYIKLEYKLSTGSTASVNGATYTDGGGLNNITTIYFKPNVPLTIGGDYTMTVHAKNQAGLEIDRQVTFKVQDQTPPDVSLVELISNGVPLPQPLTSFQVNPDTGFSNVTEIWATLSIPSSSTNVIDWTSSTISLYQISNGSQSAINMIRLTPAGTIPTDARLHYQLVSPLSGQGSYLIVLQTFSKDASGNSFAGPPTTSAFTAPRFNTVSNPNTLSLYYPNLVNLAVSGTRPITGTTSAGFVFSPDTNTAGIVIPNIGALAVNANFSALTGTAQNASAMQFVVSGPGAQTQPITWNYGASTPLRITLYYNNSDLPPTVTNSNLQVFGYTGVTWQQISSGITHTFTNVTGNTFVLDVPNGSPPADAIYAIFYPSSGPALSGTATAQPTAVPFKATRSFNPSGANVLTRKAKFYYADVAAGVTPKEVEVKVYDTAGTLIRGLNLGAGVNLTDIDTDPNYARSAYFFNWDGTNDTGNLVKNGIYLVRYRVTMTNGNSDTQTKVVALIK